jgi:hypothetical protein
MSTGGVINRVTNRAINRAILTMALDTVRPGASILLGSNFGGGNPHGRTNEVLTVVAILLGAVLAAAGVVVVTHDATTVPPAPTRQLYNYGSG